MIPLTLSARLSLVLCALLLASSAAAAWLTVRANRLLEQELVQRLSSDVAEHIGDSAEFMDENGLRPDAVTILFDQLMAVNPSVEVYLLDSTGTIVGHAAPSGHVLRERVTVEPIERLLAGAPLPILGDDPRSANGRKVFDAARLELAGRSWGYIYVILLGETRDALAADVASTKVLENTLGSMAVIALLTALAGLVAFRQITRPLRGLARAMHELDVDRVASGGVPVMADARDERDEIAVLRGAFRRMAQRIGEQWRTLRRQDQERRELIANVSHDLRTPLTSLHGFLETLAHKRDLSDAERERYLKTALQQSGKVTRLAHELFELTRLEHDASSLEQEPFSLGDVVQDVVQELGLLAAARRQRLTTEVPPNVPNVVGSLRLIDRALTNLIDNAIRHSPAGGEIAIALRAVEGGVEVVVRDDGPGIPADVMDALFAPSALGGRRAGTGLGLQIVRRILELHGSHIELDRTASGTRVRFELTAAKAQVHAVANEPR
ncbi:MAG TPA: ATP-binding protein [Gammaproteobacteria bacterium]|nr:ATP-binding protein [Gammaproteobacteria bacterium]